VPAPAPGCENVGFPRIPTNSHIASENPRNQTRNPGSVRMRNPRSHHKQMGSGSLNAHRSAHSSHVTYVTEINFHGALNQELLIQILVNTHAGLLRAPRTWREHTILFKYIMLSCLPNFSLNQSEDVLTLLALLIDTPIPPC
jgi:hypothetical protein